MDSGVQMPEQINDSRDAWHHYRIRLIVFDQKINPGFGRDCPFMEPFIIAAGLNPPL
jgi:hypothetical protein